MRNDCCDVVDVPRSVSISPVSGRRRIAHGDVLRCSSDGNPAPTYHWTTVVSDPDSAAQSTFSGAELTVDVCNLTAWDGHASETTRKNVSGTTRLTLSCHAENTVGGRRTTASSTTHVYHLALPENMDQVCSGQFTFSD